MKRALVALCAAALAAAVAAPAHAEGEYYIEIGREATKADAAKEWQALAAAHKNLLGKLTYYPKEVIHENAPPTTRLQAGPIKDRETAEKTCTHLFKADVPCFVLEGLTRAPVSIISLSQRAQETPQQAAGLPWIKPAPPPTAPPQPPVKQAVEEPVKIKPLPPLPWLVKSEQPAKPGEVKVAEAVRVPVSQENATQHEPVTVRTVPAPESVRVELVPPPPPPRHERNWGIGNGWLSVSPFLDQETADEFWSNVQSGLPHQQASSLQARITGPAVPHNQPSTTLTIGPFATREDAYAFCTKLIQPRDSDLRCLFENNQPVQAAGGAGGVASNEHAGAYDARRRQLEERRREAAHGSETAASVTAMQLYWLQLQPQPSEMDALNQWNDVKTANSDLVDGLRSSVVDTTVNGEAAYVVRLGPMTSESDATGLCKTLQGRGIDCRVLHYSNR